MINSMIHAPSTDRYYAITSVIVLAMQMERITRVPEHQRVWNLATRMDDPMTCYENTLVGAEFHFCMGCPILKSTTPKS